MESSNEKCIVLLSGGLDSATVAAIMRAKGFDLYGISFDYQQRHKVELEKAKKLAESMQFLEHKTIHIDLRAFGGSALTDDRIAVPKSGSQPDEIPVTYVPARNTIFLSFALAFAEVRGCQHIAIGVNAVDYSGYPDCRPEFIAAFEALANCATKAAVLGERMTLHTPLIDLTKREIIDTGLKLGVDYGLTSSCYDPLPEGFACGECDSCRIRMSAFESLGLRDPALAP